MPIDSLRPTSSGRSSRDVAVILAALVAGIVVAAFAGCQTPSQQTFAGTVPPPATGAIGQPAPYASYVSMPQGAAYPPGAPLPGPAMTAPTAPAVAMPPTTSAPALAPQAGAPSASTWQSAVPPQPPMIGSPAASTSSPSTWSWSQTGNSATQPSLQQYGAQLQDQATQAQQGLVAQGQQSANQMQQQLANQWSQLTAQQQQQLAGQMQNAANQMQGSVNQFGQQANTALQQANTQAQQAVQPSWPTQPTQQTANGSWWPFNSPSSVPPARATPTLPAKY